jgi:hypothetical protein
MLGNGGDGWLGVVLWTVEAGEMPQRCEQARGGVLLHQHQPVSQGDQPLRLQAGQGVRDFAVAVHGFRQRSRTQFQQGQRRQGHHIQTANRLEGEKGQITNQRPGSHQADDNFTASQAEAASFGDSPCDQKSLGAPVGLKQQLVVGGEADFAAA